MMKLKFNQFERVAGLFLFGAILGVLLTALSVAIKQGWFEKKIHLSTTFESADGIHQGTLVQMAGLRAGAVESVELLGNKKVQVRFYVLGKFKDNIHADSRVQLIRPFIIGERVLEISLGSFESGPLAENQEMPSEETLDMMSMLSGKKWNGTLEKVGEALEGLQYLAETFLNKERTQAMVRSFDRIDPLMQNLNSMSVEVVQLGRQLNQGKELKNLVQNLALTTREINKILPQLNQQHPELAQDIGTLTHNLTSIVKALGPALRGVEGDLPVASRRLVEVLDETAVVLKAVQKSFLMEGNVKEVREQEVQENRPRLPANQD